MKIIDKLNKKGFTSMGAVLGAVIGVVLLISAGIALWPTLNTSLGGVAADMPLASLFSNGGVIALGFAAALVIGVLAFIGLKGR